MQRCIRQILLAYIFSCSHYIFAFEGACAASLASATDNSVALVTSEKFAGYRDTENSFRKLMEEQGRKWNDQVAVDFKHWFYRVRTKGFGDGAAKEILHPILQKHGLKGAYDKDARNHELLSEVIAFATKDNGGKKQAGSADIMVGGRSFTRTGRGLHELRKNIENLTLPPGGDPLGNLALARGVTWPHDLLNLKELKDKDVIDVCTGDGTLVTDINENKGHAVGVDAHLSEAQKAQPTVFKESLASKIDHPDNSFDVAYSQWGAFIYSSSPAEYAANLREMIRIVRSGGHIRISPFRPEVFEQIRSEFPQLKVSREPEKIVDEDGFLTFKWKGEDVLPFAEFEVTKP